GDIPVERDVVQVVLAGPALHRVFLARIAHARQVRMAEHRVRIDVDLRVQRDELTALGDYQGIHLDQARILLHVEPIERTGNRLELRNLRAFQSQAEGDLPALVGLQARGRVDVDRQDLLRRARGHLLDVHAARGGGNERYPSPLAVQRQGNVDLPVDLGPGFHVHPLDRQPLGAGLLGLQALPEHAGGRRTHGVDIARDLDTPRLATPAGVHLGFHHPHRAAQGLGDRGGFLRAGGDTPRRYWDAVTAEHFLGLILVQIHRTPHSI